MHSHESILYVHFKVVLSGNAFDSSGLVLLVTFPSALRVFYYLVEHLRGSGITLYLSLQKAE